jgi:hypothetical protein
MLRLLNRGRKSNVPHIIVREYAKQKKDIMQRPQAAFKQYLRTKFEQHERIIESTPELFDHKLLKSREMLKKLNIKNMLARPAIPSQLVDPYTKSLEKKDKKHRFVDPTKLNNQDWIEKQRKKLVRAFAQLDLHVDLYPHAVEKEGFYAQFINNLSVNLSATFPSDPITNEQVAIIQKAKNADLKKLINVSEENLYRSTALLGNYLEAEVVKHKPTINYQVDSKDDFYTLVMLTPDYPFRLVPDQGGFINWMVTNIPGNDVNAGEELVSYLPPLPTEHAGTFRYIFMLYKQPKKLSFSEFNENLKQGRFEKKQAQDVLKEDIKRTEEQRKNMRKFANEYEYEYLDQLLEKKQSFVAYYMDGIDKFPLNHSDYRPPKPIKAITDPSELSKRRKFDLCKFVGEDLPVGLCFFRTEYDICVSQEYEKHGWEEPFYVPPDLMHQNIIEEHKIYMGQSTVKNRVHSAQWI